MKRHAIALLSLLVLTIQASAAKPVKIIGPAQADPYTLVEMHAEGDLIDSGVIWDVTPEDNVSSREYKDGTLIFTAPPGVYRLKCRVISFADKSISTSRATVTIGGTPGPGPGPVPPGPADPLTATLQAAYATEAGPDRAKQLAYLAAVYKAAPDRLDKGDVLTVGDLFAVLKDAIHGSNGIPQGSLPNVTKAVGTYLNVQVGTPEAANVPLDRMKAKAALAAVGQALGGVK